MPRIRAASIDEHKALTKRALLDAAQALIRESGTADLPLGEIAIAAGVGRTTLYDYFDDRDDLIATLVEDELPGVVETHPRVGPAEWEPCRPTRRAGLAHGPVRGDRPGPRSHSPPRGGPNEPRRRSPDQGGTCHPRRDHDGPLSGRGRRQVISASCLPISPGAGSRTRSCPLRSRCSSRRARRIGSSS